KRRGRNDSAIYVGVIPSDARQEVGSTKDRSTNEAGKKLGSANLDVGLSQAQRLAVPNTNIEYEHRLEHIDGAHAPSEESFIEESADALEARPHPGGEEDSFTIAPDFSEI